MTEQLPGTLAYEYSSDEPGDMCWDSFLGLVREGCAVYRVPDLMIDVSRTFQRTEFGGLVLRVHIVDGVRVGYLCDSPPRPPSKLEETIALAEATSAELIKQRLIRFLRWPCHGAGLLYEWGEVVDELLDASEDATPNTVDAAPSRM